MIREALVEIPIGSWYKYEVCKLTGRLQVNRPLPSPLPYNYGFFPGTLSPDGDPLDVCILGGSPIEPLSYANVRILGALICVDNGESDDKILAIVEGDESFFVEGQTSVVRRYLSTYKPGFEVKELVGPEKAIEILEESERAFGKELFK
jgi:inorganic pyrophosphatase